MPFTPVHVAGGRGGALRAGIRATDSPLILMLHADTALPPCWDTTWAELTACSALLLPVVELGANLASENNL